MNNAGQFKSGNKKGQGRKKGSKNKSSKELREIFTFLLDSNLGELQAALDVVKNDNPAKYIELILRLTEFALPKLNAIQQIEVGKPKQWCVEFAT